MKVKKVIYIIVLFFFASSYLQAQEFQASIRVISRVTKDSVILRWAPSTPIAWHHGNALGYIVTRYVVSENGKIDPLKKPIPTRMTPVPLKPLLLEQWEPLTKKDKYAAIAAQALYGKNFIVNNSGSQQSGMSLYHQTQEQESRHSFVLYAADLSAPTSKALGLRFVDKNLDPRNRYAYKIEIANYKNPEYAIEPGTVFIDPTDIKSLPPVEGLKAESGDHAILLSWKTTYVNQTFVSYQIERSDDNGKTFHDLGEQTPFLNMRQSQEFPDEMLYLDSIAQNQKAYFYRIRGVTPFGDAGPYSENIQTAGINSAAGIIPAIRNIQYIEGQGVKLTWDLPTDQLKGIKEFRVARGRSDKGPFTIISSSALPSSARNYVDNKPSSVNYYVVKIIDEQGKESGTSFPALFQLEDNDAPAMPLGLVGEIDSMGVVKLEWTPNKEADLVGYRVFRSNSLEEQFVQVTRDIILASIFQDTVNVNTLTRTVFYKVVALDNHFNSSNYSLPLALERPDFIPPAPSSFVKGESTDRGILLGWTPAVSSDAKSYRLLRVEQDTTFLLSELAVADSILSYQDTKVTPGKTYRYGLVVVDRSGLVSDTVSIGVNRIDNGIRPDIEQLNYTIDHEKNAIMLSWKYHEPALSGYQIYRGEGNGLLRLYKFVKSNQYTDYQLHINTTYRYSIKAIFESGAESKLSKNLVIKY